MKTACLLILLLTTNMVLKAQNYIPFPTSNAFWTEIVEDISWMTPLDTFVYSIHGDTLINGVNYSKIIRTYWNHQWPFQSYYIREQNKIIYFRDAADTMENVLYNFNVLPGDSVWVRACYPYCLQNNLYIVTSIDSEMTVTGPRKAINLNCHGPMCSFSQARWVEGIGDVYNGLMYPATMWVDEFRTPLCFIDSGNPTWYNNAASCLTTGVVENLLKDRISVYPNPSSDYITISSDVAVNVTLHNLHGQRISHHNSVTELILCKTDYGQGLLIAEIISQKERLYIKLIFN